MEYKSRDIFINNMKDFGCDDETIAEFLNCFDQKNKEGQKHILQLYRKKILDELHKKQRQIDKLDHMVYQINKFNYDEEIE